LAVAGEALTAGVQTNRITEVENLCRIADLVRAGLKYHCFPEFSVALCATELNFVKCAVASLAGGIYSEVLWSLA